MKNTPYIMIGSALVALAALLTLPWVGDADVSVTLLHIITSKAHGYQVAYAILAPLAISLLVGAVSIKRSARWQTAVSAVLLLIPTGLSAVANHAALGAHIATASAAIALVCAAALTVRPIRLAA
jgi:hypothetical protein